MVGLVPTDGSTMLVKQFAIGAETTISGVQLENNDAATAFPEVALLRGPLTSIAGGTVVATASNVRPGSGIATVHWPSAVSVRQAGTYYVVVRFPSGPGRQGIGQGPALGANNVAAPNGSYVAGNTTAPLVPARIDLAMSLVTSGSSSGSSTAEGVIPEKSPTNVPSRFFAAQSSDGGFPATFSFGLATSAEVVVSVYDVAGRLVRDIVHESLAPGSYERQWDGRDERGKPAAAGVYLIRFQRDRDVLTDKLVVTK